jgi:hypothetical protein
MPDRDDKFVPTLHGGPGENKVIGCICKAFG